MLSYTFIFHAAKEEQAVHHDDLWVCYERDLEPEKDYAWISRVFIYTEDGEEVDLADARDACDGVNTCRDQGDDLEVVLRCQVEAALRTAGFSWKELHLEDDSDTLG